MIIDPQMAGLAQGASVLGQLAGPSRTPAGIGSILGQLGGAMYGAQQQAVMQQEKLANDKLMREAQAENLRSQIEARKAAEQEKAIKLKKVSDFNSILGQSEDPTDPVSVLGAGVKSGAFGPEETTKFMSSVMERRAAREQRMAELRMRAEDQKIAREEREAFQREIVELQGKQRKEMLELAATLKPAPAPEPLVAVDNGDGRARYVPRSEAVGKLAPPRGTGDRLTESEAKGTLFYRQMSSAEEAVAKITGDKFDPNKLGNQVGMRMANSDWTNWAAPAQAQQYAQATEQWAEAYLRAKTGAATNRDEIKRNARAYFPQPGDSPQVITQKNEMRLKAIQDMSIIAGRGVNREPVGGGDDKAPWEE